MRHLPLFFLLILAVACQPKDILRDNAITKGETIHIPFDATAPAFPIDKIFKEYEFIALETNDSIFVRDLDYIPQIKTFSQRINFRHLPQYILVYADELMLNTKSSSINKYRQQKKQFIRQKKLTKVVLNLQGKVFPKEQMMKILGGGSAYCHCYDLQYGLDADSCSQCDTKCSGHGGVQNRNTIGG
ncbi:MULTISPECIES: hypothetical protein [Bacteroidales]|nr:MULTISPECIES: hypothetical protein [Bacteroidales]